MDRKRVRFRLNGAGAASGRFYLPSSRRNTCQLLRSKSFGCQCASLWPTSARRTLDIAIRTCCSGQRGHGRCIRDSRRLTMTDQSRFTVKRHLLAIIGQIKAPSFSERAVLEINKTVSILPRHSDAPGVVKSGVFHRIKIKSN